jgi:nitrate reductase assembly molybdenum cofactor insertion protein NarJ
MKDKTQYHLFSELFRYPVKGYHDRVNQCMSLLLSRYPDAANEMQRFVDYINSKSLEDIEEVFGKTFHIQAICYLDIGYVIFGEDYKRGEFLVHMKQEQQKANNDCGEELADNLANVLELMTKTEDLEFLDELAVKVLMPALNTMLKEFDLARMELKNKILKKKHKVLIQQDIQYGNIYFNALKALLLVLEKDFQDVQFEVAEVVTEFGTNFLPNCGTCSSPAHSEIKVSN